ncbi:MAG: outer membrane lipoprotein carrier protein LolA, partial [Candidatus Schekmanbacteria bacterium]
MPIKSSYFFMKLNRLKKTFFFIIPFIVLFLFNSVADADKADEYLKKIEKRYENVRSITIKCRENFFNKTLEKTFTFKGEMYIRRPDKFRWEITSPDEQLIVIDGENLWIYTKENNQVIREKADKKGRAKLALLLLADINELKKNFTITFGKEEKNRFELNLLPVEKTVDVKSAVLYVNKDSYKIEG